MKISRKLLKCQYERGMEGYIVLYSTQKVSSDTNQLIGNGFGSEYFTVINIFVYTNLFECNK